VSASASARFQRLKVASFRVEESNVQRALVTEMSRKTATRADLLDAVYSSCPALSRAQARDIFEMALEEISDALVRGEAVKLRSFGLFSVRAKRERIGRNPRTGIEVPIKPRRVLTFKPSPVLIGCVNGLTPPPESDDGL
jgi:integration host factor subunit alpha